MTTTSATTATSAFELSDDLRAWQQEVRSFARERVRPVAAEVHRTGAYPRDLHRELGERGYLGVSIPAEMGGGGRSTLHDAIVVEELTKFSGSISLMATYVKLTALPIVIAGNAEQQRRWLPDLCRGSTLGSYAITEPHAGSNPADLRTTAERTSAGWVINGEKKFIGNAGISDVHVVFARTGGPDSGADGISVFAFAGDLPGIDAQVLPTMGMPGWHLGAPTYTDVEVGEDALLGEEGDGFGAAMGAFDTSRPFVAAQAVGLAQGATDLAMDYALRRHTFGRPIVEHQAIAFKLAQMEAETAAARAVTYQACAAVDAQDPNLTKLASIAKMFASDVGMRVTTEAVQVLGGNGYLEQFPAERMMRDAKVLQIYEGTNEIQKLVISRAMQAEAAAREPIWPEVMPGAEGVADGA